MDQKTTENRKILIVEDNLVTQNILAQIVTSMGYVPISADDGWTGLAQVHDLKPAAIIMDLSMPNLDGFAATLLIREMFTKEELPIIACTADSHTINRKKAFAYGMNDWLVKPVVPVQLQQILQKWLEPADKLTSAQSSEHEFEVEPLDYLPTHDVRVLELVYANGQGAESFPQRKKFVEDYLTNAATLVSQIIDDAAAKRAMQAILRIRQLKQLSVIVGAPRLSRLCQTLESELSNPDLESKKVEVQDLKDEFLRLKETLDRKYGLKQKLLSWFSGSDSTRRVENF